MAEYVNIHTHRPAGRGIELRAKGVHPWDAEREDTATLGQRLDDAQAVVMAASTAVTSSPDKSATDLFVLHEGTLVKISDWLEGWCEITIADGKKGWLACRTIERI